MNYAPMDVHLANVKLNTALMKHKGKTRNVDGIRRRSQSGENTMDQVMAQIKDSLDVGVDGICIYNYGAMTDNDFETLKTR